MTVIQPNTQMLAKPIRPEAAPRFGNSVLGLSSAENAAYKVADTFMNLPNLTTDWIKQNRFLSKNKALGKPLTWLAKNLLDHDYKEIPKVPLLGRNVIEPPIGALVILLFGFTLMGRLKHAIARASEGDTRELGDIFRRDIPTFSIILFALKPLVNAMSRKILQPMNGIQLMAGGEAMSYSGLKNVHTITHANRLKFLMAEPATNRKGVLKAIENTLKNPWLQHQPQFKPLLHELRGTMEEGWKVARSASKNRLTEEALMEQLEKPAQKAFKLIQELDLKRKNILLKEAQSLSGKVNNSFMRKLIDKFIASTESQVPKFSEMFARHAKGSRVWANLVAYGIVIGVLGYGVTAFNQWWTEKNFQKQQAEQAKKGPAAVGGATPHFASHPAQFNFHPQQLHTRRF